jgi:hypothetical protein
MVLIKRDVILKPYAVLRQGQNRWDGWYDVLHKTDRRPIQTFVRVPSPEGFQRRAGLPGGGDPRRMGFRAGLG